MVTIMFLVWALTLGMGELINTQVLNVLLSSWGIFLSLSGDILSDYIAGKKY